MPTSWPAGRTGRRGVVGRDRAPSGVAKAWTRGEIVLWLRWDETKEPYLTVRAHEDTRTWRFRNIMDSWGIEVPEDIREIQIRPAPMDSSSEPPAPQTPPHQETHGTDQEKEHHGRDHQGQEESQHESHPRRRVCFG
jgi:hypothetical protein